MCVCTQQQQGGASERGIKGKVFASDRQRKDERERAIRWFRVCEFVEKGKGSTKESVGELSQQARVVEKEGRGGGSSSVARRWERSAEERRDRFSFAFSSSNG